MMNGAITMTDEQWAELCVRVRGMYEWAQVLIGETSNARAGDVFSALDADLRALIAEVDDANTRARYTALAAADQLDLFGEGQL